ncbi:MAG TPA: hypothetical protein VJ820_02480 [Propionibacteriaceae bacterium]|nr:hypothetical protein [Propionibacteriaceae bacterium]
MLAVAGLLVLGGIVGALEGDPEERAASPTESPTLSPATEESPEEDPGIADLEGYTCEALRSAEDALQGDFLQARIQAACLLDEAASEYGDSLPNVAARLSTLAEDVAAFEPPPSALGDLRRLRDESFPFCEGANEPEQPAEQFRTFEDGVWVVGEDIKPGIYRNADPGSGCYWERMRNFSGGLNSILANGLATGGPIVAEILKSDKGFTSQDCGEWSSDLSRVSPDRTRITDGIWIVGVDLQPGTYRTPNPGGDCYWERMRDFSQGLNSIIANGIPGGGNAIVEIRGTDAGFTSQDCGTWTKV